MNDRNRRSILRNAVTAVAALFGGAGSIAAGRPGGAGGGRADFRTSRDLLDAAGDSEDRWEGDLRLDRIVRACPDCFPQCFDEDRYRIQYEHAHFGDPTDPPVRACAACGAPHAAPYPLIVRRHPPRVSAPAKEEPRGHLRPARIVRACPTCFPACSDETRYEVKFEVSHFGDPADPPTRSCARCGSVHEQPYPLIFRRDPPEPRGAPLWPAA